MSSFKEMKFDKTEQSRRKDTESTDYQTLLIFLDTWKFHIMKVNYNEPCSHDHLIHQNNLLSDLSPSWQKECSSPEELTPQPSPDIKGIFLQI